MSASERDRNRAPEEAAGWGPERTAVRIAERVRRGEVEPVEMVRSHLERIAAVDPRIGAFQAVRRRRALAEAEELAAREDLSELPLAGVPVAVKDNVGVAGEPMRLGSVATSDRPREESHPVVRRLRAAGAVVVGTTRLPELAVWGTTDSAFGVTRNPWDVRRTAGGSSGGSAAAVAAGMVPAAHGNDGLGSIRIPAAACGLVGVKPGSGVVPAQLGAESWYGMSENGPLATTVDDAALLLSAMADRPELAEVRPPQGELRVAVSTALPLPGLRLDPEIRAATLETAHLLADRGHRVRREDPPYPLRPALAAMARWFAGTAAEAEGLDPRMLASRTRRHAQVGKVVRRLGLVRPSDAAAWRRRVEGFFAETDLLVTPALAEPPIPAEGWHKRGWLANMIANTRFGPFAAPWNLAGAPAASVPAGLHSDGVPLAVQLVAPRGEEARVLDAAALLEELRPWRRHPPEGGS